MLSTTHVLNPRPNIEAACSVLGLVIDIQQNRGFLCNSSPVTEVARAQMNYNRVLRDYRVLKSAILSHLKVLTFCMFQPLSGTTSQDPKNCWECVPPWFVGRKSTVV